MLLQQLATNFGVPQRIGDSEGKFFLRQSFKVPIGTKNFAVETIKLPAHSEVIGSMYIRHDKETGIVNCTIAFTIELKSYLAWLNKETSVNISPKKYDLFISYKRNTARDFAVHLKQCLTEEGYVAFLDLTDIPKEFAGTEKWFTERDEAIKNSKRFLLIMTIKVDSSEQVVKELTLARTIDNMKFIYMRHDALKPQIILKTSNNDIIDLSEGNQETFINEFDLVRKVFQILQESKT